MNILQISPSDRIGGAERIAFMLFEEYRKRGHASFLAVAKKTTNDPAILQIPSTDNPLTAGLTALDHSIRALGPVAKIPRALAHPARTIRRFAGVEEFGFPGSRSIPNLPGLTVDLIHAHNLHGNYFDLRLLADFSKRFAMVLTLHDAWLLSGHCAHSLDCDRWLKGCGQCPYLHIYPDVRRDATAFNFKRKRAIYQKSRLYIATPSQWLMDKVNRSMLADGIVETKVIHNPIDDAIYHPADHAAARNELGIDPNADVLLFTGFTIKGNVFKDYTTIRAAATELAAEKRERPLLFLALGDTGPEETIGNARLRFIPFQPDPKIVAKYIQASDLYLHAARADTFPNSVIEALACGVPVVATAVGGIPEQIHSIDSVKPTGILTRPGDGTSMAAAIRQILDDAPLRRAMSENAVADAKLRFNMDRQVGEYLSWFEKILASRKKA